MTNSDPNANPNSNQSSRFRRALGAVGRAALLPVRGASYLVRSGQAHQHFFLPVVAWCMNLRSRLTGLATGDQGLFMTSNAFLLAGGFAEIPLMEDLALCAVLRKSGPPLCLRQKIITSGRRWEKHGVWRTILLMWRLRLAYFFGADPVELHRTYYGAK